jgi:hypothetical protein
MNTIRIDSDVDVRCDFCGRVGRRGYMTCENDVEIFCPACYAFLYGELDINKPWFEKSEDWEYDFSDMCGKKNV